MSKCPKCGSEIINGRCVRFTEHKDPKRKKKLFIGHIVRKDPHGDKEDTRPVEKRKKKPDFSMEWKRLKRVIERGK